MNARLRAVCDLSVAEVRENAGRHDYDGVVQDLSPSGVRDGLARLGLGQALADGHDESHLQAAEDGLRAWLGLAEDHRRNPLVHLANLDLAGYDREYAPAEERDRARRAHLAAWPDGVDAAVASLDLVAAPVAASLLGPTQGLAAGLSGRPGEDAVVDAALAAHERLVAHLRRAADHGPPDASLGGPLLARVMGDPEAMAVDIGRLAERADAERARLGDQLGRACQRVRPGVPVGEVVAGLLADRPRPEAIYTEARAQIDEITAFTVAAGLLDDLGGQCLVGPAPPSRRWAMAMMSWTAPNEAEAPAWYHVNPPDPAWSPEDQEDWLAVFSATTLPVITAHEVTPGHYAHGRMLRRLTSDVRRTLFSSAFVEGWAHYGEELLEEVGFRSGDGRFAVGVALEALTRVTRLSVALGLHTGTMTTAEAARRFEAHAFLPGRAARSEAERAAFDPTYGRYTWGKLEIRALRDQAEAAWGLRYSHLRFHNALLGLGSPPLGLMGDALGER